MTYYAIYRARGKLWEQVPGVICDNPEQAQSVLKVYLYGLAEIKMTPEESLIKEISVADN